MSAIAQQPTEIFTVRAKIDTLLSSFLTECKTKENTARNAFFYLYDFIEANPQFGFTLASKPSFNIFTFNAFYQNNCLISIKDEQQTYHVVFSALIASTAEKVKKSFAIKRKLISVKPFSIMTEETFSSRLVEMCKAYLSEDNGKYKFDRSDFLKNHNANEAFISLFNYYSHSN